MQLSHALITTLATIVVAKPGIVIPEGTEDGIYAVSYENGTPNHSKIAAAGGIEKRDPFLFTFLSKLGRGSSKDQNGKVGITCGTQQLDPLGITAANTLLDGQCGGASGNMVPAGKQFYSKRNGVVAYVCNLNDDDMPCTAKLRLGTTYLTMEKCGQTTAGSVTLRNGIVIGYGAETSTFCGSRAT